MQTTPFDPVEEIAAALIEQRPLVLFAGQNIDPGNDSILADFLTNLGSTDRDGWRSALSRGISAAQMEWLSERFDRSVPSDVVAPIYDVPWSAVFTSSIDPRFARRFETKGRQPESVLSKDTYARVPRSRSRPPIYYLFGKSDEVDGNWRAPRKNSDLARRLIHATELLNRIADTVTVRGLVVIAGYDPENDWMPVDSLLAPLSNHPGRPIVLWLGLPSAPTSSLADEMAREGSLVTIADTIADAISKLELRGLADIVDSAGPDEPGTVSISGDVRIHITPALRLRVEASAAIVDDVWTESPEPIGEHDSDVAFRRFHSTPGNFRLLLDGLYHGFAIERGFEQLLWKTVTSHLNRLGQPESDDVVVLHGQSGTGKSIALARLIRKIRLDLKLPVVVATNRIPNYADIEAFCLESERLAPATVLICDSNQAPQRYDEFSSALRSRGRKLLIVGSCYRVDTSIGDVSSRFVEAPTSVTQAELAAFARLRIKYFQDVPYENSGDNDTHSIFALLYRRLPPSRGRLAAGVSSEARSTEGLLRKRARHLPRPFDLSQMALQLIEKGFVSRELQAFSEDAALAAIGRDSAGRLIDYVMASGRLDCPVPVNLVFRLLSQVDALELNQIIHLFSDLDLFRWSQNEEGADYMISPRLQLEANLICERRLNTDQETELLVDLIRNARPGIDRRSERSFLLNILYKVDRNGPRDDAYRDGYLRFADALKQLREYHLLSDPDIVLRECVLRRRAVFQSQDDCNTNKSETERFAILDDARDTIDRTLHKIDEEHLPVSPKTKRSLYGERAAIYGYLAVQRAQSEDGYWSDYLAARMASAAAIGIDRSLHPIDVALWTAKDVLERRGQGIPDSQRAELLADIYATIDVGDEVLGVNERPEGTVGDTQQVTRYLERRSRIAHAIGDSQLDEGTLHDLEQVAPTAATFLIARRIADSLYTDEPLPEQKTRSIAAQAADYISARADTGVELDDRCLRLLLRLRWTQATEQRPLLTRRGRTPVNERLQRELLEIVSSLNERGGDHARNNERFLEAVLCWILRDYSRAVDIWRSLSAYTEYQDSSRVIRWLVATDAHGLPSHFRGRLEKKNDNYWVRVEGVGRRIRLLANEFPNDDLDHGRELRGFGIAFNYIGPVADPLSRPIRRR